MFFSFIVFMLLMQELDHILRNLNLKNVLLKYLHAFLSGIISILNFIYIYLYSKTLKM